MHIVYLIGNGFDIALGLKTKYIDFYNYYIAAKSKNSLIEQFKSDLKSEIYNTDKWSDFELGLGEYVNNISKETHFDEIMIDVRSELSAYLTNVQNNFSSESNPIELRYIFLERIFQPERYLSGRNQENLSVFYNQNNKKPINIDIINFNYTNTIEQILGITQLSNEHTNLARKLTVNGSERYLNNIYHVHGSVTADMVIGVNDAEQIRNIEFRESKYFRNEFIKSECNRIQEHGLELKCMRLLNSADIICIFGSSLGKTDNYWWKLVAEYVSSKECRLIVFDYQMNYSTLHSLHKHRYKREIIKKLFGDDYSSEIEDKVFVSLNSDLFNLKQE